MTTALLVALGAAVGAPARLLIARAVPGSRGTLAVNVAGSLLLGVLADRVDRSAYALLGTGLCGAFTTFSTFALDAVELPAAARLRYVAASVLLCVAAAAVGVGVGVLA